MADSSSLDRPLRLVARADICAEGAQIRAGEWFETQGELAVSLVLAGKAELFPAQFRPPHEIITKTEEALDDLGQFGPVCLREKAFQNFEETVLAGGSRRNVVAGKVLHWLRGPKAVSDAMAGHLGMDRHRLSDLSRQLRQCWDARLAQASAFESTKQFCGDTMRRKGLVLDAKQPRRPSWIDDGRHYDKLPVYHRYRNVEPEWAAFSQSLEHLASIHSRILSMAFQNGQILAVTEENGRSWLVPPWEWKPKGESPGFGGNWHFLFSKDLPAAWFPKARQLRGEERRQVLQQARKALEKRYLAAAPNHQKYTKKALVDEIARELAATPSLVREAWDLADIPCWKAGGRRKDS